MQLSEHFNLAEMTVSHNAARLGIDNTPSGEALEALTYTAEQMEKVRAILGNLPVTINSAYRNIAVNKLAGSKSDKSQHTKGEAVDFICPKFGNPRKIVEAIIASDLKYDQVILEFDSWVHISFKREGNRMASLIIDNAGTRQFA